MRRPQSQRQNKTNPKALRPKLGKVISFKCNRHDSKTTNDRLFGRLGITRIKRPLRTVHRMTLPSQPTPNSYMAAFFKHQAERFDTIIRNGISEFQGCRFLNDKKPCPYCHHASRHNVPSLNHSQRIIKDVLKRKTRMKPKRKTHRVKKTTHSQADFQWKKKESKAITRPDLAKHASNMLHGKEEIGIAHCNIGDYYLLSRHGFEL